ncbi:MAG: orotidine-5'-phosphate decarboxylase [Pyrinomonadaceae bacterium]
MSAAIVKTPHNLKEKLIVALDVDSRSDATELIAELGDSVGAFKIGLQLFAVAGPEFVRKITSEGHRIFLDLKFHDIPNTAAKAAVEAAKLGVWMFNLHALGGSVMMRRTVENVGEFCVKQGIERPKIIAVTVLTSSDANELREIGIEREVQEEVVNLARLTAKCGLDGVVASAQEAGHIKNAVSSRPFVIVTPGIRSASATKEDQKRVMTPGGAINAGSDYLVIGRPITNAPDRVAAVRSIIDEIESIET